MVPPEKTVVEAATTMLGQHVSGLPIVDAASKLVGIVSEGPRRPDPTATMTTSIASSTSSKTTTGLESCHDH
jgi:predicted transcriptional regulator